MALSQRTTEWCRAAAVAPTEFGRVFFRDPQFVADIVRRERTPREPTRSRLERILASPPENGGRMVALRKAAALAAEVMVAGELDAWTFDVAGQRYELRILA